MQSAQPISMLMFGTLVIGLLIIGILLARFLSKRRNRHPMAGERERNIDEIRRDGPDQ